jgi:phosphate starvation-inducible PhoH-like protein
VLDENLRQIETALNVSIARRGEVFQVEGDKAGDAARLLKDFYQRARKPLDIDDIQLALVEVAHKPQLAQDEDNIPVLMTRRAGLHGRTARQNAYIRQIQEYDITFGIGPAGTGKTYLAVAGAVDALERDMVKRIVLVRPAVEAGEHLGFLPGDLVQKVDPYLRPLYDALWDLMGFDKANRAFERQMIEVAPLAFMRGRTLNHAFIILDEAQNTTPEQMKMFLTRIGFGSRAVVTGDVTQIDLARHQKSGLIEARQVLKDVRGIAFTEFQNDDVVRHPWWPASSTPTTVTKPMPGSIPKLELAIQFAVKAELPGRADFRRWAKAALKTDVAAALRVVGAEEGLALNSDYRGKDYATNVLTFEYGPDPERRPDRRHRPVRAGGGKGSEGTGQGPRGPLCPPHRARHAAPPGLRPRNRGGGCANHGGD